MKELNFEQMENIQGGDNRGCMITGGVVFYLSIAACFVPPLWAGVGAGIVGATSYGCF